MSEIVALHCTTHDGERTTVLVRDGEPYVVIDDGERVQPGLYVAAGSARRARVVRTDGTVIVDDVHRVMFARAISPGTLP